MQKEHAFKLGIVIFPVMYWLDESYPFKDVHKKITLFSKTIHVPALDLFPSFKGGELIV